MQIVERKVVVSGIRPVMFDRYPGDNDTKLEPSEMMYYDKDGKTVVIPSQNILGMMGSNFYDCACKRKWGSKHKDKSSAVQGFVDITPTRVPFVNKGKPIQFKDFNSGQFYIDESTARINGGGGKIIPNPRKRPVLELPWSLEFTVSLLPNNMVDEKLLKELLEIGGLYIGIGTWRGRYGKFVIDKWE